MTPRLPNWPDRLQAVMVRYHTSQIWGRTDCACCALSIVRALTGAIVADDWRGRYVSKADAFRKIKRAGVRNPRDMATLLFAEHGWPEIDPRAARVGDIGYTEDACFCVRIPAGFAARDKDGRWGLCGDVISAWGIG